MKAHQIDPVDPVSVISCLAAFKIVCNNKTIHEKAAMWLAPYFMRRATTASLLARRLWKPKSSNNKTKIGLLTTFSQFLNHPLETYVTNDVIVEASNHISFLRN